VTEVTIDFRGFDSPPAKSAAVTPEQAARYEIGLVNVLTRVLERRDVESVYGAIEFAKKASLAIVEPRDRWNPTRRPVEDVVWTGIDTGVAFYAARSAYELYHQAHATFCSSSPWSLRLLGAAASFDAGKSRRR
jgi:hypothetical protein